MARKTRIAFLFTTVLVLAGVTPARAQSLRVMTWNIAHGDLGGLAAHADFIVAQDPQVLVLQEVSPGQEATYEALLEQRTGVPWNVKYKQNCERFGSPDPEAPNPVCNQLDGDGVAILSRLPFQDEPSETLLFGRDDWTDARRALRVKVRVGGQDVQVFGTHLAAGAAYEQVRINQMNALKTWMSGFTGPRILGGDLNAVPGSQPIQVLMSGGYIDAWAALRPSETGSSSFTHSATGSLTRRIDYWFSEAGSAAQPFSIERPAFPSGTLSDHYSVVAVYTFSTTAPSPLVGHWKLDDGSGSTTATDSSGNGATGTLINSPAWTTGAVGGALSFNGTTQLVSIPNQPSWNTVSNKYTVAFWVKVKQIEDYAGALAVGNWGTGTLEIMTTSNRWNARIKTVGPNGWACDATSSTLGYLTTVDNAFHHVALVLDAAASRCYLYSDGVLVATDEYVDGTTSFGTQNLNIGGFGDANRLESVIDDVRLYNAALTQAEVQALANTAPDTTPPSVAITAPSAGATVSGAITVSATAADNVGVAGVQFELDGQNLGAEDTTSPYSASWNTASASNGSHDLTAVARDAAGNTTTSATVTVTVNNPTGSGSLVGHWKLDDGSGSTTAADSSGNGATGTLINSPAWTTGAVGGALSLNGTTQLVSIPNQPSWNTVSNKYTVAFWVKVKQIEDYAGAVAVGNWGTGALQIMTTSNRWMFRINTDGPNGWDCDATSSTLGYLTTVDNAFHHVALVLDATASRCFLYSDGVLVSTDEYVDGTTSFGTQNLNIGGFGDANRLESVIDDVRLYNTALTQAEVQALAAGGGG